MVKNSNNNNNNNNNDYTNKLRMITAFKEKKDKNLKGKKTFKILKYY